MHEFSTLCAQDADSCPMAPGSGGGGQTVEMKSRVHPKYKTRHRVTNRAASESALVRRGDLTIWLSPEAIAARKPASIGKRGGQWKFSDLAIESAGTLRLIDPLPLRQTGAS